MFLAIGENIFNFFLSFTGQWSFFIIIIISFKCMVVYGISHSSKIGTVVFFICVLPQKIILGFIFLYSHNLLNVICHKLFFICPVFLMFRVVVPFIMS